MEKWCQRKLLIIKLINRIAKLTFWIVLVEIIVEIMLCGVLHLMHSYACFAVLFCIPICLK